MNPVQSDRHYPGGLRSIRGGRANAVKEHVFTNRFLHLMFNTGSAAPWINERVPRLLRLLVGPDELQLDEVPLEGLDERVNQRVGGGSLLTQDRERIVDWR
jgi:hypothetical protein